MTDLEAIEKRCSRRSYLSTTIPTKSQHLLNEIIEQLNKQSGLSIQLIIDGSSSFQGVRKSYGMFSGVQSFIAMVGNSTDINLREKIGYYGELLILEATKLGLGTCWVGGTYDRKHCPCKINKNEELVCVITVGLVQEKQSFKEKAIYKLAHRGSKPLEMLYYSDTEEVPEWFLSGMKAVQKAPSAVNRQPVRFVYQAGEVSASVKEVTKYELVDLGIAKVHFEIGAGGKFSFGNKAVFIKYLPSDLS
ncbi:nitroreductase [Mobilitalea sibirica]|uniref:Nitroreductase n=1 Tax=Mobilitalea sibirica TaxID=1462919 RepID=A0A8J7H2S3_9FIRM|nr:nitroreductase family protein [Mobilitalea sibirica]MBH1941173.1 nitroreductase [Mobilitalea sibirica]